MPAPTPIPKLTTEDRRAALDKALEVRRARAQICAQVKAGELSASDALARRDDPVVGKIKVEQFIRLFPGLGKAKAARIMQELDISEHRRLAGLGPNQVAKLTERLS